MTLIVLYYKLIPIADIDYKDVVLIVAAIK